MNKWKKLIVASYSDIATEAGLNRIYAGNHTRIEVDAGYTLGPSM